jgi:SHS2 domain-containing protein
LNGGAGEVAPALRLLYSGRDVYEMVDHTGDLALRVGAASFTELVVEGVFGIASILFEGDPDRSRPREHGAARVSGVDRADALVQALSEALHWMQEGDRVPLRVTVLEPRTAVLELQLEGVSAAGSGCRRSQEIKAVTYHDLQIRETSTGLETTVVLDV